jgi:hypothetical protein
MMILLWADSTGGSTDPIGLFVQYGIAGLVIVALLMGLLWAKPAVMLIIARAERAEAQRDELLKVYSEKVLPALTDSVAINRDMRPVLVDVVSVLNRVKEQMDDGASRKPRSRST